jgi:hypothetical protein
VSSKFWVIFRLLRRGFHGQVKGEGGAGPFGAGDFEAARRALGEPFDNRQAEAVSLDLASFGALFAEKLVEDVREVLRLNPGCT